jgi:Lar family restriction alleviation protein
MAELKPCPFCGGKAVMHDQQVAEDCVETWVECDDCGVRTDPVEGAYSERPAAAYSWNRRAPLGDTKRDYTPMPGDPQP